MLAVATALAAHYIVESAYGHRPLNAALAIAFTCVLILSTIVTQGSLRETRRCIEDLDRRHRLRIDFVSAATRGEPDAVHSQARAFLANADIKGGCEIFGVNSYLEATSHGDQETDAIRAYYGTIEKLAVDGARYTRVVQLPNELAAAPYEEWATKTKAHYKDHFENVLAMHADQNVQSAYLLQVRSRFPLSFLLIKNANGSHYLIWQVDEQIHEEGQDGAAFRLHGIFLVEDPDRKIASHFLRCIDQLRNDGNRVSRANI